MNFSERYGYKPVRETIQFESMDKPLRNGLWNILKLHCWDDAVYSPSIYGNRYYISKTSNKELYFLCIDLWSKHFKEPADELNHDSRHNAIVEVLHFKGPADELNPDWEKVLAKLRSRFFKYEWYDVYDFIGFIANNYKKSQFQDIFITECNHTLEEEMSAYRFIGGVITPITEKQEIEEIE